MLSVLMSVYSKELPSNLNDALGSVWSLQTVKPGQIVLVKDGPLTFKLDEVIDNWKQALGEALTVVGLTENVGLGVALNQGLKCCKYELVARMDTDDVAMPERFEKQIEFMWKNTDIAASSATLEEWNQDFTQCLSLRCLPSDPEQLATFAIRRSPLSHPLTIFRKDIILSVGGYPPLRKAQDYALWSLLLVKGHKLANLPDVLLKMRAGNDLLSRRGLEYFRNECELLRYQRKIGFLKLNEYCFNFFGKAVLRSLPRPMQALAYKFAR